MNPAYRTACFRCEIRREDVPARFAIITAFNPEDRICPDELNRRADLELAEELDRVGCRRFRVTGGSPDFSHAEAGWGCETGSLESALLLGRRFRQAAIYWVDHDVLVLADCPTGSVETLGNWSDRTLFRE
jgi:hypothetical protein